MLLRRGLLSSKQVPNTVTIPFTADFAASNGATPSVNSGCTLSADSLYIPSGCCVEYKLSDLYPKDFTNLSLEMDLMYTKTKAAHGWFDFFAIEHVYNKPAGVNYNDSPREKFKCFDVCALDAIQKYAYFHVIVRADFSQGDVLIPHGEVVDFATRPITPFSIARPSAIRLGHYYPSALHDGWEGYVKNVKITFD